MCCVRCDNILRRVTSDPIDKSFAYMLAALFLYGLALTTPMLDIAIFGRIHSGDLATGFLTLDKQGYWMLATVVLLTTIVIPLIKIIGSLVVLGHLHFRSTPHWLASLYAVIDKISPWSMVEIYIIGLIVAYTRLQTISQVHLAAGVVGLGGLMLAMSAAAAAEDPEAVWERIGPRKPIHLPALRAGIIGCDICKQVTNAGDGEACSRCGHTLRQRKHDSVARSWAFVVAAFILYIPSNIFPVMNVIKAGRMQSYTIYAGIRELAAIGLWPLALLVFVASIAIPIFKIATLVYLLVQTHRKTTMNLRLRTRLYRIIDFIGRWSMIDIFMVSILVATVRFGWFANITADAGAIYFGGVVALTLLATHSFDPRLMWDAGARHDRLTGFRP